MVRPPRPIGDESVDLTVAMTPKAFVGPDAEVQHFAISSWVRAGAQVILMGAEHGTREVSRELGVGHVAEVQAVRSGTPSVPGLIHTLQDRADCTVRALVNADIALVEGGEATLRCLAELVASGRRWLGVARRRNVEWGAIKEVDPSRLAAQVAKEGRLHPASGSDLFIFAVDPWDRIPPLAVGRTYWDAWLLWAAHRSGSVIVDLTPSLVLAHPVVGPPDPATMERLWFGTEAIENGRLTDRRGRLVSESDLVLRDGTVLPWSRSLVHVLGRLSGPLLRAILRSFPRLRIILLRRRWRRAGRA